MFGATQVLEGAGVNNAGRPKLPIRLMVSLLYLKHSFNLSDEELVVRWSENVLWQFFSGLAYYEHRLPCDATQIGRFRRDLGEEGLEQLLKATIDTAVAIKAVKPKELERVIVDTTVQEGAIAHPVDSRLLEIARHKVVSAAKRAGIQLKQTFAKEGKELRRRAGGYAHAKQFRRLKKVVKRQRTILGVVMREVQRKRQRPDFAAHSAKAVSDLGVWLHSPRQVQELEPAAKGLAAPTPGRRTGDWTLEVRPPTGPLLAARRAGRRAARCQLRCGLQPALADARDCRTGAHIGVRLSLAASLATAWLASCVGCRRWVE